MVGCETDGVETMPKDDYRYLENEAYYLDQVADVWIAHVASRSELSTFYDSLPSDEEKNLFLRVGAFYRYLVKEGSFLFEVNEWNRGMSFIDDTYKYIALFALIEALEVPSKHLDFYQWLQREAPMHAMAPDSPLVKTLEPLYREYKAEYGSIHAAVTFFSRLDTRDQNFIQDRFTIQEKEASLKKLAQKLYDIRSEFVHKAQFVLWFGQGTTGGYDHDDVLTSSLSMDDLCTLFEHGFLKRFGWKKDTQQDKSSVRGKPRR
jgi:hypothetical protein